MTQMELRAEIAHLKIKLQQQDAKVERLRAALETARHGIMGHFDDDCSDCRETLAVIDAALEGKP